MLIVKINYNWLSGISYHLLHRFHIFEHHIFRTTVYLKGCSRGTIVTAIYFSLLMGCMKLCYQNYPMWAITLNAVQVTRCNKVIIFALVPYVALIINPPEGEFVIRFLPLPNRSEFVVKLISRVHGTTLRRDRQFIEPHTCIWTVTGMCLSLPSLWCSIVPYCFEISLSFRWKGFLFWYLLQFLPCKVYGYWADV